MGGRAAGVSAHYDFHCQHMFSKLSGQYFYQLTYRTQTIILGVGSRHERVNDSVRGLYHSRGGIFSPESLQPLSAQKSFLASLLSLREAAH